MTTKPKTKTKAAFKPPWRMRVIVEQFGMDRSKGIPKRVPIEPKILLQATVYPHPTHGDLDVNQINALVQQGLAKVVDD